MDQRKYKKIKTSFTQNIAIQCVVMYQNIRPFLDGVFQSIFGYTSVCKHSPSCSEYAEDAIQKYGTMRGIILGVKRIMSCR